MTSLITMVVLGSLGETTLMQAAMDNDMAPAAADDPDATVDLRPPTRSLSTNRKRSSVDNKTLSAVEAQHSASFTEDRLTADCTRDITMDIGDGMYVVSITQGSPRNFLGKSAPPLFRIGDPALCRSRPLVTPWYYCRLGDVLCFFIMCVCVYCFAVFCVVCFFWVFFTFVVSSFPSVL